MKVFIVMANDFPEPFVFEDEETANTYADSGNSLNAARQKEYQPAVHHRVYPAELVEKSGGALQRAILLTMADKPGWGPQSTWSSQRLSAAIKARTGKRYLVENIAGSIRSMTGKRRGWVEEMSLPDAQGHKCYRITQAGRAQIGMGPRG